MDAFSVAQDCRRIANDNGHRRNILGNNRTRADHRAPSDAPATRQDDGIGCNPDIILNLDAVRLERPFGIIHVVRTGDDARTITDDDVIPNLHRCTAVEFDILKRAAITNHKVAPPLSCNCASGQHVRQPSLRPYAARESSDPCADASASVQTAPRNSESCRDSVYVLRSVSFVPFHHVIFGNL